MTKSYLKPPIFKEKFETLAVAWQSAHHCLTKPGFHALNITNALTVIFEEMLNSEHEFAPGVDKLTLESPAPVQLAAGGLYPTPQPGRLKDREF